MTPEVRVVLVAGVWSPSSACCMVMQPSGKELCLACKANGAPANTAIKCQSTVVSPDPLLSHLAAVAAMGGENFGVWKNTEMKLSIM